MYHARWKRKKNVYITQAITYEYVTKVLFREFEHPKSHDVYFVECTGSPCKCIIPTSTETLKRVSTWYPHLKESTYKFDVYCFYRDQNGYEEFKEFVYEN